MAKLADYFGLLAGWLAIMAVVLTILAGWLPGYDGWRDSCAEFAGWLC
jgi:membrane protein YqaA with SNARE-associated domain